MIAEALLWTVGTPTWLVGGTITAKAAIAQAERYYINLSYEEWKKNAQHTPQEKMDADDWIGAGLWGVGAFAVWPVVAVIWILKWPFKQAYKPFRKIMLPPQQKAYEQKWDAITKQKELVLSTAQQYKEALEWDPEDDPNRQFMLQHLQEQGEEQLRTLRELLDPNNPSGRDMDYLDSAKDELRALTRGSRW